MCTCGIIRSIDQTVFGLLSRVDMKRETFHIQTNEHFFLSSSKIKFSSYHYLKFEITRKTN